MRHETRARALRPVAALALAGAALGGCGLPDGHYGGGSGYYGSSGYQSSYRYRDSHRHSSQPRSPNNTQQRLQQHWLNQARKPR